MKAASAGKRRSATVHRYRGDRGMNALGYRQLIAPRWGAGAPDDALSILSFEDEEEGRGRFAELRS